MEAEPLHPDRVTGPDAPFRRGGQLRLGEPETAVRLGGGQDPQQQIEYERSGYLLWGMADGIDLAAAKVKGLPTLPGYGRVQLENVWLA
ncbi:hypothetical protein ACGFYU_06585 [Streptomyces sp. NPDC048337]|uniref:hypothetical protein n=1 Tax=Streptomyces sp. NPDC048337 TaxID=3365535 RepID=UPI00371C5CD3